jgi:hypothetical protein
MPNIKSVPVPFRLFFYGFDCNEPRHVHILRDARLCKFWCDRWSLPRMSTVAISADPRIREVTISEDAITANLADGRVISVPLSWSWRLSQASPRQRENFQILGNGQGIRWPEIDEDIRGMLYGAPARRTARGESHPRS